MLKFEKFIFEEIDLGTTAREESTKNQSPIIAEPTGGENIIKTSMDNRFKALVSKYKNTIKSDNDNPKIEQKDGLVTLKVNVGFIIESKTGNKYDLTYAATAKNNNLPLYYVKSDDTEITNISGITFIEDKDWNNVKGLFEILKSWKNEPEQQVKQSNNTQNPSVEQKPSVKLPVEQNSPVVAQKANYISKYTDFLNEEIEPVTNQTSPPTSLNMDNVYMSQIGETSGKFANKPRFNEASYTINKLLFGKNSKYKLNNVQYKQFINLENTLQPASKKANFSTVWYIEKKIKDVQGDENYKIMILSKQINSGDFLNLCKYKKGQKVDFQVSNVQIKKQEQQKF